MAKSRTKGRQIDGILLLDKPKGMTSNAALQVVKKIYEANKAGHTGSLDPLASGMLPICLGEATKFSQFLLEADKYYQVVAKLGIKTTTGDQEGAVISELPVTSLTLSVIEDLFAKFTGAIKQVPSMYSAIKRNGRPLYELARQGIEVERESREVNIYGLKLLDYQQDQFSFEVRCSKGTYIRTLVEDMGDALGCGAHVAELRRLGAGPYRVEQMKTMPHLEELAQLQARDVLDSYLLPVDSAVDTWPNVQLSEAAAYYLKQGQPVIVPHAPSTGWIRLSLRSGNFLGVGEILDDGRVAPRRLVQL